MYSFPLLRTKWSNEHSMALLFVVLVLYHLPVWTEQPVRIVHFLLLLAVGFLIDCIAVLFRHKRLWCCVSAAVTAAMVSILTINAPLWGQLLGVATALIAGKQLWGGTGKNPFNPAMVGVLLVWLLFPVTTPLFAASYLLLPAALLSLLFIMSRPFASIGTILGMLIAIMILQDMSALSLLTYGVLFWSCLVLTDPVTVTSHPVGGAILGLVAGLVGIIFHKEPIVMILAILVVNAASALIEGNRMRVRGKVRARLHLKKAVELQAIEAPCIDLTENKKTNMPQVKISDLKAQQILQHIKDNKVFGMGGAAFSTYQKLQTVIDAKVNHKYLILNGVECDPGLVQDAWLLRNHWQEIKEGIAILEACVSFQSIHLAVKHTEGLQAMEKVKLHQVPDRYPIGAERILIQQVLKKEITKDQIPAAAGILVLNVQTIYAIYQAVVQNEPISTRYITVADLENKKSWVVKVNLGSRIYDVMEAVLPGVVNAYVGGGIMQAHLAEEEDIVDMSINLIAAAKAPSYKESPQCSHCGKCSHYCPSGLEVGKIVSFVEKGMLEQAKKYPVADCISCGSCSYLCPAGRELASKMRKAKEAIRY